MSVEFEVISHVSTLRTVLIDLKEKTQTQNEVHLWVRSMTKRAVMKTVTVRALPLFSPLATDSQRTVDAAALLWTLDFQPAILFTPRHSNHIEPCQQAAVAEPPEKSRGG